jgi:putative ABC transport system permease protein
LRGAAMSASGFGIARVPPLLGRPLLEADQTAGAPEVAVIGYDVWQSRFGDDPNVVGRTIQIGSSAHTIVGVMPEGFRFPFNEAFWVPLREEPAAWAALDGPGAYTFGVFGRLREGATLEEANAELRIIGEQRAADLPATHARLRPEVVRFGDTWTGSNLYFHGLRFVSVLLLIVISANVGVLLFARNAAREAEMLLRTSLGASRGRICAQLFLEALVLSTVATVLGIGLAYLTIDIATDAFLAALGPESAPFWSARSPLDRSFSPRRSPSSPPLSRASFRRSRSPTVTSAHVSIDSRPVAPRRG